MPTPAPLEIALCSWSLGLPPEESTLRAEVTRFGLRTVHLGLAPLVDAPEPQRQAAIAAFKASPLVISAGMINFAGENYANLATIHDTGGYVPDALFDARFARTLAAARIAQALGLSLLTTHAGFIPEAADAARFATMVARLQKIADALAPLNITLCFETGQETAETLAAFLTAVNRPNIGVNFDPANMILYGKGDPVNAVIRLAPWLKHVHAKDARKTLPVPPDPEWKGHEVPLGQGDARLMDLVLTLHRLGYTGPLAIEREVGPTRGKDIALGISHLKDALARISR